MITIDFTYQTVTPESAENGDFSESGFILPEMWKFPNIDEYKREHWEPGTLAHFVRFARELGVNRYNGSSFESSDADTDYSTGEDTYYSMHIDGVTPSTFARIARLITGEDIKQ